MEQYLYTDSLLFLGLNPSTRGEKGFYTAECDQFFAKSMEIADEHSAHFCHHDLFPIRETKQNVLLPQMPPSVLLSSKLLSTLILRSKKTLALTV